MREPRREPGLRFGLVAARQFDRRDARTGERPESRDAGLSEAFGGDDGCGRSPNAGKADRQRSEGEPP